MTGIHMAENKDHPVKTQSSLSGLIQASESFPFGFLAYQKDQIISVNSFLIRMCGCSDMQDFQSFTDGSIRHFLLEEETDEYDNTIIRFCKKDDTTIACRYTRQEYQDSDQKLTTVLFLSPYDEDHDQNVYDSVSGLYQKEYLFHKITDQLKDRASSYYQGNWNMIFVNITGFKGFNDDCGYTEGNRLLRSFAKLLVSTFHTRRITRVYADHFAILYQGKDVKEKVNILHEQALLLREDFYVWTNAGIYPIETWNDSLDVLLDYARTACGVSQENHQPYCIYSDQLREKLERKKYIISHIDEAIEKGWITLYFQPVIRTLSGKICSGEALARWNDPVYGMISPGEFVPILEENRLSCKLASFVIDTVAGYVSESERMGMYPIPVSFNLSRCDFDDMDPFEAVEQAVKKYGISRNLLCIEITESTVMDNPDQIGAYIRKFHQAGYEVWMDDFGSAYSSLNTLKDFDFDEIKLDMVFMRNFNEKAKTIISSCINMAKDLGIHTLCEGVETEEQAEFLLEHGCEKIQGFYYSKPRPVQELKNMIDHGEFGYELSVERFLYDEAGKIRMDPHATSAVLLCTQHSLYPLEISRELQRKMAKAGVPSIPLHIPLNTENTELGQKLNDLIHNCHDSHKKEEISCFLNGKYYVVTARQAGESNAGYICEIRMQDITESARGLVLGNATEFTRSLTDAYDCVYSLDSSCQEIQIILSDFPGEATGRKFPFDPESMSTFIYWKDRDRFRKWIHPEMIRNFIQNHQKRSVSELFRLERTDGSHTWELTTLIHNMEKRDSVYLCMKPADMTMQSMAEILAEKEGLMEPGLLEDSRKETAHEYEVFCNALLEQKALKIFHKDRERRFTAVSRSFLEYFGLTSDRSVLGKTMEECAWLLDGKDALDQEKAVLDKGKETAFSSSHVLVNGVVRHTVVLKFPVYENGKVSGLAGIFVDEDDLRKACGMEESIPFTDEDTDVMNFTVWMGELSAFEDDYNRLDQDYAVGVLTIRSYWKTYHEFGWKTAEQMAKVTAETIRAEIPSDCMIGRMDKETFVIASMNTERNLKDVLKHTSSVLATTHYIGAFTGSISSFSAASLRSETSNLFRSIGLTLERAESEQRLRTISNERNPRSSVAEPETPADSIMTQEEADNRIHTLLHSFDFVRLVDPDHQKVIRYERNGVWKEQKGSCFDIWQTGLPCENCISQRTFRTKQKLTKFETDGENIFIVISQYVEVDGKPAVMEMVMRMRDSSSLGADERGIFIRTLANCRARMYQDTLTGIHNRLYYDDILVDHHAEACALIDIDDLKEINETYGHLAGDAVLHETAGIIARYVSINDLVRYDGDCFLISFTKVAENDCMKILERIRQDIHQLHFDTWPELNVRIRIGCVCRNGRTSDLIKDADRALTKAEKDHSGLIITH